MFGEPLRRTIPVQSGAAMASGRTQNNNGKSISPHDEAAKDGISTRESQRRHTETTEHTETAGKDGTTKVTVKREGKPLKPT